MSALAKLAPRMVLVQLLDLSGVLAFFVFVRMLNVTYGPEAVGIYAVIRRVMGVGIPLLTLGLNESLAYSVASTRDEPGARASVSGALLGVLVLSLACIGLVMLLDATVSRVLFGNAGLGAYAVAAAALIAATAFAAMLGSIARGLEDYSTYAWIQIVAIILGPFLAIGAFGATFGGMLTAISCICVAVAIAALAFLGRRLPGPAWLGGGRGACAILAVAISRLPGLLLAGAVPLLIVLLAGQTLGLARTGQLAVALSVAMAAGGLASTFGVSALPVLASSWQSGNRSETQSLIVHALSAALALMLFGGGVVYASAEWLGSYLFPFAANGAWRLFRLVAWLVPLIGSVAVLRYALDAISGKALNTRALAISSGIVLLACGAGVIHDPGAMDEIAYVRAFAAYQILLIGLSVYFSTREGLHLFRLSGEMGKSLVAGTAASALVIVAGSYCQSLAELIAAGVAGFLVLLVLLYVLRAEWPRLLIARSDRRQTGSKN